MNEVDPIRDRKKIDDMKSILKANNRFRDLLWITIGLNSALRIGDILSLKVKDVRKENGEYRTHIRLREQKTGKNNRHKINDAIREAMDLFFEDNPSKEQEDYLFTTYAGQISRQRCDQIIKDLTDRLGLEGQYATHSLRKTFGYHAIRQGVDPYILQSKFNHSSRRQTLDYCGLTYDDVDDAVDELNL
ncbi:tyrosine-type recombinase/integrase [Candidatus Bipolaricaulota bacterium]|nr:tyrosine-type recombinase/integrase [Candidatus Bipolaricaulota bacterium]